MNILERIEKWVIYAIYGILILTILNTCNSCNRNKDQVRLKKEIISLKNELDILYDIVESKPFITKEEMKKILDESNFSFLIYEDDLDKVKTSLSNIKNKLDELRNESK